MEAALQVLVGAIIAALGANLFTKAAEDAAATHEMIGRWTWDRPPRMRTMRTWSNRFVGAFFVVFGLAICVGSLL